MTDPTRQRDQPALTTSSGLIWLVLGGVLALIAIGTLVPLATAPPSGVALTGAVIVGALYIGMLAVRTAVRPGRLRLGILAGLMLAIAAVGVFAVLIVAAAVAKLLSAAASSVGVSTSDWSLCSSSCVNSAPTPAGVEFVVSSSGVGLS